MAPGWLSAQLQQLRSQANASHNRRSPRLQRNRRSGAVLALLASLLCLSAAQEEKTGYDIKMVGDIWPMQLQEDEKRQGQPTTIQEAYEEYEIDPAMVAKFKALGDFDKGIHCAGYNDLQRITFRRIQDAVKARGIGVVFKEWDGMDDSVPDQKLNWKELRMGLRSLELYDPFGKQVLLSVQEVEQLIREVTDDDPAEFVAQEWGSSFYRTDGTDTDALTQHYARQPRTLMDGGTDNAMCMSVAGEDLGICGFVRLDNFTRTMNQVADIKYSENCNGHGICDLSVGVCHCQAGWTGFNCSEPEKPCGGIITLEKSYGSISDGYGIGREYANSINCTWIIRPEYHSTYGLPIVFTFVFYNMEAGFDAVDLYEMPFVDINFKLKALGVGGTFPKDRWAMPHSVVVGNGKSVAINFVSDAGNPSGTYYGFKILFGRLDATYIKALSFPLVSPGCNRRLPAESPRCLDRQCTNCGVTLDEDADDAIFMGSPENMCFSSEQPSNTTQFAISQDYYTCAEVLDNIWLQHTAGETIKMRVECTRGFMSPPADFMYDLPEYVLGSGPPEVRVPTPEEGQAFQRGYIPLDWWGGCSFNCNGMRKTDKFNTLFEDIPGKPGPIFVAQITAKESNRARQFEGPYVTRPKSRVTGLQYGNDPNSVDNRTKDEKNSMMLAQLYRPSFTRFTTETQGAEVELGQEYCEFSFTPTIPGIYQVNFFEMRKDRYFDKFVQAIPFPQAQSHRQAVIMPAKTSPGNSRAYGQGLAYYQTTRTGVGASFMIDSLDRFDNLRLTGGDQYIVALVHQHQEGYKYAEVSNLGNGSYFVVFNVTLSGRYSLSITLPAQADCPNPRRVSLSRPGGKGTRQMSGPRCDLGTAFTVPRNKSAGGREILSNATEGSGPVHWCTPVSSQAAKEAGEENCVEYTYHLPGQAWIPFKSPFSVWVDSGPITISSVKAFGTGLSMGIANYPAFFMLRIRDVFGNWATSLENITTGFELPGVAQSMFDGSTTPTSYESLYAGTEAFTGDYAGEWVPQLAGMHRVSVMLCNPFCTHIIGSPYHAKVHPAPTYGPNSTAHGNGIMDGFAGHARSFEIQDRDSALNRRRDGGEDFEVSLAGLSLSDCPVIQDQVLLDITRKCPDLYRSTVIPCNQATKQNMPGPEVSFNIPPSLTCLYRRNTADCHPGCCPDGAADACSQFDEKTTRSGFSPNSIGCDVRTCGFPADCRFAMKKMQQQGLGGENDLLQTFLDAAWYRCPQVERLGLEARMRMPPDHRKDGQYNLQVSVPGEPLNSILEPDRPPWKGPMSVFEIQNWISRHDLAFLYYNQTKNINGYGYFAAYGASTGPKENIEGFVLEVASAQGRRESETSVGPSVFPLRSPSAQCATSGPAMAAHLVTTVQCGKEAYMMGCSTFMHSPLVHADPTYACRCCDQTDPVIPVLSEEWNVYDIVSSLRPSDPVNANGNFSWTDNDDGTYSVIYNITRAGLYSMSVLHSKMLLKGAPFEFIVRPEAFEAKNCICNGTGVSKDKDTHSGIADYKGNQIAGKRVAFDISLRDQFWNYLWVSKPESDFKIYLDPMRIRYYDTTIRVEKLLYWSVAFDTYTFHDFGDANYKVDYRVTTAGNFPINIRLKSPGGSYVHLDKSPYMMMVRPDKVDIASSTAFGGGLTLCGAGLICTFAVETRDQWGNRRVLDGDEGPYCHTWNANVNNGGSGGNQWREIFPSEGCTAGEDCSSKWMRWANTMPASGYVVDGPEEPQDFPAYNNEVAYHARGGILHDCVPKTPFASEAQYNQEPSCITTRQGPCGKFDEWGRLDQPIWLGDNDEELTYEEYKANYPEKRPRYTAFIKDAQPVKYERFDVFIDPDNVYSGNYNITAGGNFVLSIVYIDPDHGLMIHVRGSPFDLVVTGGLTDPLRSSAEGQGLESAVVGYPSTFLVFARDRFSNKRTLGREIVQVFIQPTNFGLDRIPVLVHDRLDGTYYVEYNATISGRYTMSVSLLEQDVAGSPFKIQVQKGFNFPHFNSTWGLHFAGSAYLKPEQGHVFCWGGQTGCVSQVRLNLDDKDSVGGVWYNTMQRISNGFETRFSFSINSLSRHCKTDVILSDRCMARGGDGFAFVIHDNSFTHALGAGASSMGYGGIDNSIAFEFDTWYNSELGDVYQNHIAVHTMGTEKNIPSSRSRLVSSTDIPNLSDGHVHTVRIRYEPWMEADSLMDHGYSISPYTLQWIGSGAGTLRLWIDDLDRPLLTFPLNLENILALTEGRAYLGFTASTGEASQNHYIHSWSYVDTICLNDCNDRGNCIEGKCYCEPEFSGEDCRIGSVEVQQIDHFLCPTQNQKEESTIAASNCSCPAGSYGPIGGPCEACPIDTWKTAPGESSCIACPPNSDSGGKAAVQDRSECKCKAGYIGTDGGPCLPVPEDTYKVGAGAYKDATIPCPANSGTVYRQARSNVLDCLCKPGYQGPNGGPCLVCPTESWKASWGDATCESQCPPFSETFGCDGPGGNTGCISQYQCVCKEGYTGRRCLLESPQHRAGKTCTPCVRTSYGPMNTNYDYDPNKNPLYDSQKDLFYTIPEADHRDGVKIPPKKRPPVEFGTDGVRAGDTPYQGIG